MAFPYLRAHGSRPFLYAKRAHFPHSFRILRSLFHACGKLIGACVTDSVPSSASWCVQKSYHISLLVLIVLDKHARLQEESLVQPTMLLAFCAEGFAL